MNIQQFSNDEFSLRIIPDGDTFTVEAPGLARALGFRDANTMLRSISEDEKGYALVRTPGGDQRVYTVTEPGLYRVIGQRQAARVKDTAARDQVERFQTWVYHEVLPAIRRTGSYGLDRPQLPQSYAEALRELAASVEAKEQMRAELELAAPKADAWDVLASATGDYSLREAAQSLDRDPAIETGQRRLLASLRELGWVDGRGTPYQRHVDNGRIRTRIQSYDHPRTGEPTLARPQIRVTVKGLRELHQRLGGVRPLVLPLGGAA